MSGRGFALLAVLWALTVLSVLAGAGLAAARLGSTTTRNRLLLARAGWAREACTEILLAQYSRDSTIRALDSVDLGRGTWCHATLEDPGAKINVNLAGAEALKAVFGEMTHLPVAAVDSIVKTVVEWRDPDAGAAPRELPTPGHRRSTFADVAELRSVPGLDDALAVRLTTVLTTRGTGAVNLNIAPAIVLRTVPGLGEEAIELLVRRRMAGQPVAGRDELAGLLSSSGRQELYARYAEFLRRATFAPTQLIATIDGGVRGTKLVARLTLTGVPVAGRLAVIQRETE